VKGPGCQAQFAVTGPPPGPEPVPAAVVEDYGEEGKGERPAGRSGAFVEFLLFRRMIAPLVIQAIFWVGSIVLVLVGLGTAVLSLARIGQLGGAALLGSLFGFAYMIVGP